jgi:hypothetical protein
VCVAMFAALAPTVSHAIALAQGNTGGGIEICTSEGMRFVAVEPAPSSADSETGSKSALSLSHCPFCLHNADRVAPPPTLLPYLFLIQGGQQEVTVWQAFFYPTNTTFKTAPRGPPATPGPKAQGAQATAQGAAPSNPTVPLPSPVLRKGPLGATGTALPSTTASAPQPLAAQPAGELDKPALKAIAGGMTRA